MVCVLVLGEMQNTGLCKIQVILNLEEGSRFLCSSIFKNLCRPVPFHTQVTVTDNGSPPKSTIARVIVKILDENDNKPQFLQKFYKIRLPERERPERERNSKREPIYRVIATDKDEGPNAEISYSIEDGNEHGKFFIEPKTGVVSSKKFSGAGEYDILSVS